MFKQQFLYSSRHHSGESLSFTLSIKPSGPSAPYLKDVLSLTLYGPQRGVIPTIAVTAANVLTISFSLQTAGSYYLINRFKGKPQFTISNIIVLPGPVHVPSTKVSLPSSSVFSLGTSTLAHVCHYSLHNFVILSSGEYC